jgi:hypothetical protein
MVAPCFSNFSLIINASFFKTFVFIGVGALSTKFFASFNPSPAISLTIFITCIVLKSAGDKKIQVIKIVREIAGLGLKEAKNLVDSAPTPIKTKVLKKDALIIKEKLEKHGATIEVQ